MSVQLRPLTTDDEAAFLAVHRAMQLDHFVFGLGYEPGMVWADYLAGLEAQRLGVDLAEERVPATFLVADVAGEIVGRTSIRHRLNAFLEREGGHIGFGVLPEFRRRGYATEILRESLVVARSLGIGSVLVTCDDDNVGSATVIERCHGQLESIVEGEDGIPVRRYWIN